MFGDNSLLIHILHKPGDKAVQDEACVAVGGQLGQTKRVVGSPEDRPASQKEAVVREESLWNNTLSNVDREDQSPVRGGQLKHMSLVARRMTSTPIRSTTRNMVSPSQRRCVSCPVKTRCMSKSMPPP